MKKLIVTSLVVLGFLVSAFGAETVTLESLLNEMTDARMPTVAVRDWTGRLWSSADPSGANQDYAHYLAIRTVDEVEERIMVDATGPGAVVRIWCANPVNGAKLRFYIDGDDAEHRLEVNLADILGGTSWAGAPLSSFVSPTAATGLQARNLYLPIPYAQSLKVAIVGQGGNNFWYNIETRTYVAGTSVESFSQAVLSRAAAAIAAANVTLSSQYEPTVVSSQTFDGTLAPGAAVTRTFDGPAALSDIRLSVSGDDTPLDKVRVLLDFDGERTLNVSLGQFFGCGIASAPFTLRHLSCSAEGLLRATRVMPFATAATLTITNCSSAAVTLAQSSAGLSAYAWDAERSMHFGGYGTYDRSVAAFATGYDRRWVTLRGEGALVGNQLSIDNTAANYSIVSGWWGEGDEKITVDGATTYLGTGTEDFFGYAYGPSSAFSSGHPFCALPIADNVMTGSRRLAVMARERALDVVPFTNALDLAVEIWHWQTTTLDYAPASFWYMRPGGRCLFGIIMTVW